MERNVYYYEYVDRPFDDVVAIIRDRPDLLQSATGSAAQKSETFQARLHWKVAGLEVGRDVTIHIGPLEERGYGTYFRVTWRASTQASVFPAMEGELELTRLSDIPPRTQIGLIGVYRPPIGLLGTVGDAIMGHRIAEAAIRHFVRDLADALSLAVPLSEADGAPR